MSTKQIAQRFLRNDLKIVLLVLICTILMQPKPCPAQVGNAGVGSSIASSTPPDLIAGRVINAVTSQPVPRALVQLNSRAMLTDSEGRFRFERNKESGVSILIKKPGYYASQDYGDSGILYLQSPQLTAPLEFRIYPEALLTGVVLAPRSNAASWHIGERHEKSL